MTTPASRCVEALAFPRPLVNRPGLRRIGYRIGTYHDVRAALLRWLDMDPVLEAWTYRGPDDPGIALLESAAVVADILTFYQELYANEGYLRTAQWRESVAELVRLVGYRLSPGVGGRGTFAFEVRGDLPVRIPRGFPLAAQVEGLEGQADFETTAETVAWPWLSRFALLRPVTTPNVTAATTDFVVTSPDTGAPLPGIVPGSRLLVGDPETGTPGRIANPAVVIVDRITQRHGETRYHIRGALTRATAIGELVGWQLGRSYRHFGHTAPATIVRPEASGVSTRSTVFSRSLNGATAPFDDTVSQRIVSPTLAATEFPLDSETGDLAIGSPMLVQGSATCVVAIRDLAARSPTWGGVSGGVTMVTFGETLAGALGDTADIRDLQLHQTLGPRLTLRAASEPTGAVTGHELDFIGTAGQVEALRGRALLLARVGVAPMLATVTAVAPPVGSADRALRRRITLDVAVALADYAADAPSIEVFGNLAPATQGKTERETVLGNGDSRERFQTFRIPKAPLTYLVTPGSAPPEVPELQIEVEGRRWTRVAALHGHAAGAEIYVVREDEAGSSWVQFGDGKTGARLPSGVRNVVARWRTGVGAFGALREGTTVQAGGKLDRLDAIGLPGVISGGTTPESGDNARAAAPGRVQSLNRLVSLRDFECEALAIPGVDRVAAAWALVDNVPAVVLTVLMATGRAAELSQVEHTLAAYNRCRGPQRFPVVVRPGHLVYVMLDLRVTIDPLFAADAVMQRVRVALGLLAAENPDEAAGLFGAGRRCFGVCEYATRIEAVVQHVAGVRWTRVTGFGLLGPADDPAALTLPAAPWSRQDVVAPGADGILALHPGHVELRATVPPAGACT